ncbi:MAG: RsmB/NOP family class I SAM-dependent RNA methyltransferase [Phenylobacterium sp.]|uniref:RsmB/NOP family class I SAM-dependent RNA methyltransferase n=1 Tax=Phenylobacterium sp. TaxID=1871053 RepID=UPI001A51F5A9|nr:RsmB/NOP family class I SAM-dependent RNA methyltransferase [Phenylobacterium sp.]MBL8552978.1 RsmB/NOP family class I SAM-dependent RNA methyltransferase [Phenylobacterium sp.]
MRDGGRLAAAIEIIEETLARHRPVRLALKAWGDGARYAGAKDRAFVSGLVLDVLRRKRSLGWRMGDDSPRALALGALRFAWDWPVQRVADAAGDEPHGPGPLTAAERAVLEAPRDFDDAPAPVRGDYPDWLDAALARVFGDARGEEAAALAGRAPVDLRVNTLKTDATRAAKALAPFAPQAPGLAPNALRVAAPGAAERAGAVEAIPQFGKGWFEIQDLGSQVAALAAGDVKGQQVLDLCAGGGGKTLALAAEMANTGQIYAYDSDARRLTDTVRRGERAGIRNLQVRTPLAKAPLKDLEGRMDLVFIDAPCTGTGSWRRHPDTKWRLTPDALERRRKDQDSVLDDGATYTRPGGRIAYVTCSVLPDEDEDRVEAFLARNAAFARRPASHAPELAPFLTAAGDLRLTPRTSDTDGFYVAVLEKKR